MVIIYSYMAEVPAAAYTEMDTYYYTNDHIGRSFNLRDGATTPELRWYERHYPFGEVFAEDQPGDTIYAGSENRQTAWQPGFRFTSPPK